MNTRLTTGLALLGMSLGGLMMTSTANAQTFLVGAYLFSSNAAGATTNTNYQYDTNVNSPDLALIVNGVGKGFTSALSSGDNVFNFTVPQAFSVGSNGDLGLFFSSSNTAYSPAGSAITPDLLVSRDTAGGVFFVPAPGTTINNYHFGSPAQSANGSATIDIGASTISVTSFGLTSTPSGSFTVRVSPRVVATPEPGSVALLVGMGVAGGVFTRRRRTRKK
jgi:hypothetical protein